MRMSDKKKQQHIIRKQTDGHFKLKFFFNLLFFDDLFFF